MKNELTITDQGGPSDKAKKLTPLDIFIGGYIDSRTDLHNFRDYSVYEFYENQVDIIRAALASKSTTKEALERIREWASNHKNTETNSAGWNLAMTAIITEIDAEIRKTGGAEK